jgi:hypothetical protein
MVRSFTWRKNVANFQLIKETITIDKVARMLNLQLKKEPTSLRCQCPVHGGNDRALAITPSKNVFYCMKAEKGGSCIDLAAHVLEISEREAAEHIAKHFGLDSASTAPTPSTPKAGASTGMEPLDYLDSMHDLVTQIGLTPGIADALEGGYAGKGYLSGYFAFPIRAPDGTLCGYCGINPEKDPPVKFHKSLAERVNNIVTLDRRKA